MAIRSWSHSKLVDFEQCKRKAYLKHDLRIPEPERPLPPGKTEHANDRGTRVHQACEDYVNGSADIMLPEMMKFEWELTLLRELYKEGVVSLEGEWGMDINWVPTDWKTAWHRSKLDAIVFHSPQVATIIDYKTGRKFGNEIKHGEQLQLYQLNAFHRFPDLEEVHAELWYLDQDEITAKRFTRDQGLRFEASFHRRGEAITNANTFPPNPNIHSCKYCPYGPWGTNHCEVGVQKK